MNPFEEIIEQLNNETSLIEIWVEVSGRKKNTYITGWMLSDTELKEHIKIIKKKIGCNGTLKELNCHGDKSLIIKAIQLQGEHIDYMKDYLKDQMIDVNLIRVKG
jgi:translation initiation factor 1 (eIF-1/SUI1)